MEMNAKRIEGFLRNEGFTMTTGDVNLEYGQTWVKESEYSPGCFDVIEIADLDGAAGCDGQLLVTARETWMPNALEPGRDTWMGILQCCDVRSFLPSIAKHDKQLARLVLAGECVSYGWSDPAGYGIHEFVAIVDHDVYWHPEEYTLFDEQQKYTVKGFGWMAVYRAVVNAIAMCDSSMTLPYAIRGN